MTDADLARTDALLAAAREVAGCSDHGCVLRVYPRGGQGTNGGCGCIGRVRADEGLTVQAERLDLVRLLTLARQTPALVEEVRRLRAEFTAERAVSASLREQLASLSGTIVQELRDIGLLSAVPVRSDATATPPDRVGDYPMGPGWGVLRSGAGEGE